MKNYIIYLFPILILMTCSSPKNVSTPNNLKHKVYGSYANLYLPGNLKNKSGEIIEVNAKRN